MFGFFNITNATWLLNALLLVLSISASSARASQDFLLIDGIIPSEMISGQKLLEPDPDTRTNDSLRIWNVQSVTAQVLIDWQYVTADTKPIYDMATYLIQGESAVNLIDPQGNRSQSGSITITIPPFSSLSIKLNSDGEGEGAQLGLTLHSVTFPPTLVIQTASAVLNTGIAANFQPVARHSWDDVTTPPTSFSISPALPAGLSIDSDGNITGTPASSHPVTSYTVTATRGAAASSKDITVEVVSSVVAIRDVPTVNVRMGGPITPVRPVVGGSGMQALSYSVAPALPSGLTMASDTGTISGTPAAVTANASYTVTVTDGITSDSELISLAVLPSATAPIATPETVTWQAGVASEVNFLVRSDLFVEGATYINFYNGSLRQDGTGPNLFAGSNGLNSISTTISGMRFSWNNPVPGTYTGEVYFYDDRGVTWTIPFSLVVTGEKVDQSLSFTSNALDAVAGGATYTPSATATSGLTVDFSLDDTSADVCQISTGSIRFLAEGSCVINADQPGDSVTNPAPQVRQVITVAAGEIGATPQTVGFTSAAPTPTLGGLDYTPTVSSDSGLSVALFGDVGSKSVCWPDGNNVVFLAAGSCTIHAEQVGNFQYAPATAQQTFTIAAAVTATQEVAIQALSSGLPIIPFTPVTGANGVGPLTYAISPTLSEGLSFSTSTGEITGTPEAPVAQTTYTITVTDVNSSTDTKTFMVSITDGPAATMDIASKELTINTGASFTPVTGSGRTGALSYSIAPALPANLSISNATGQITGASNATSAATSYTVTVTDQNNRTGTATFSLTVNGSVLATQSIATAHVTQGFPAIPFTPVTGAGGTASLTYSVSPDLPTGLVLNSATGQVEGIPAASSNAQTFTVTVTDINSAWAAATFSLTVDDAVSASQALATKFLTAETVVTPFTPITGAGGRSPLSYSVSPDLPEGLIMASDTGEVTGMPVVSSSASTYTVTVGDGNAATASASFDLTINNAVVATQAVANKTLSANIVAIAFTPVTGAGGTGTLTYTIEPELPFGLEMDANSGEISGTATTGASVAVYTVTVTDEVLATDTTTFNFSVDGPVAANVAIASTQLQVNADVTPFVPVTGTGGTGTLSYSVVPLLPEGLFMASTTGTITGIPTTPTGAVTYTVTVTDANSTTESATFSLSVSTISSAVTLVASNTSPRPGETITMTATVTPSQATGFVSFKTGGAALGLPVALVSGVATYSTDDLGTGTHSLTAEYEGSQTYQSSVSQSVVITMLSPASEFQRVSGELRSTIEDIALSSIKNQVQNSAAAVSAATARMIETNASDTDIVVSAKNSPLAFHGEFQATDGSMNGASGFFGQRTSHDGTKRRLVYGTLGFSKTDGGTTSAFLNARVAWEWPISETAMLAYWIGLDAGRSQIGNTFSGTQESFGMSAGVYGVSQIGEGIFLSGFATVGKDRRALKMDNTVLDLNSDFMTQNRVFGTALTASIKRGQLELRPEFGISYGQMDIGNVRFVGTAFGQTDETLSLDMGAVSVATVSFTPEFIINGIHQSTSLTLKPRIECQKVMADASEYDCGGGGTVALEHRSPDGNTNYFVAVRSDHVSGVTQTSLELNLGHRF